MSQIHEVFSSFPSVLKDNVFSMEKGEGSIV